MKSDDRLIVPPRKEPQRIVTPPVGHTVRNASLNKPIDHQTLMPPTAAANYTAIRNRWKAAARYSQTSKTSQQRIVNTTQKATSSMSTSDRVSTASQSVQRASEMTVQAPRNTQPPISKPTPRAPYNRTHAPTSDTARLNRSIHNEVERAAATIAAKQAEEAAIAEAHRRYHTAWQQYYQKYYESYYVAALQQQYAKFAKQKAAVADQKQSDGKLDQHEVQTELKDSLLKRVKKQAKKAKSKPWFWPVVGAAIAVFVVLFLQYNGLVFAQIASFVSPGDATDQSIIVGTGENQTVSDSPRVIIPKINVNAPVTYGLTDLSEASSQQALQNGPIHYPITGANAVPGQKGNTVILGHSSADVFAPGNYKFIFVQLNRLAAGDLFYLDYAGKRYTYKVTRTAVVSPKDVKALAIGDDKPYATLITCDPPGTTLNRLLVFAEQVSPDPNKATDSSDNTSNAGATATAITGKPKTLLEKVFGG